MAQLSQQARTLVERAVPGAAITAVGRLQGGISAEMLRVDLSMPDRSLRRVVVRSSHDGAPRDIDIRTEAALLTHVGAHGAPVPAVLGCDDRYLVLDHLEGAPALVSDDTGRFAAEMARVLTDIHRISPLVEGLPRRIELIREYLDDETGPPDDRLREPLIRAELRKHWPAASVDAVLLHGDFWPGNLLWQQDRLVGVVDWEDAARGDPHSDVSIARLDLTWIFGRVAAEQFTAAYDAISPLDPRRLAFWDLVAALRPCGSLASWAEAWPSIGRPDITEATMLEDHTAFLDQAIAELDG